jgi:hypothetical protein
VELFDRPVVRTVLALVIVIAVVVLVATTGDSWAVRGILLLVGLDVAVRLVRSERRRAG